MKSIIFSGPSVRAILDGHKTQTRRVMRAQPPAEWCPRVGLYSPTKIDRHGDEYPGPDVYGASDDEFGFVSRYAPGDVLYVKETWAAVRQSGNPIGVNYRADEGREETYTGPWKSPIFMLRRFARLFLRVTEVRVQWLMEISEEDAIAEGIAVDPDCCTCPPEVYIDMVRHCGACGSRLPDTTAQFSNLWDSINAKRGHPWSANDWVWAYTFERCEEPEATA